MNRAIGIDIGATKIAVGAVEGSGAIVARTAFPTEAAAGFDRALRRILAAIDETVSAAGWRRGELAGVGIGCAGPVNPLRGTIDNPYTLPTWDNWDIVTPLATALGVSAFLENDGDAALLGEAFAGAARGCESAVMLTFGTGIGSGVLLDGRLYRGCQGEHPEMGHIPVDADGPGCYCGRKGCLESLASGAAITAAGRVSGFDDSRDVFAAAVKGDAAARRIVDRAVRATGVAAWTILHTFMPQRIVFGGGIADEHFELFAVPFREAIAAATMVPRPHVSVVKAQLGQDAGLVGAASRALNR